MDTERSTILRIRKPQATGRRLSSCPVLWQKEPDRLSRSRADFFGYQAEGAAPGKKAEDENTLSGVKNGIDRKMLLKSAAELAIINLLRTK